MKRCLPLVMLVVVVGCGATAEVPNGDAPPAAPSSTPARVHVQGIVLDEVDRVPRNARITVGDVQVTPDDGGSFAADVVVPYDLSILGDDSEGAKALYRFEGLTTRAPLVWTMMAKTQTAPRVTVRLATPLAAGEDVAVVVGAEIGCFCKAASAPLAWAKPLGEGTKELVLDGLRWRGDADFRGTVWAFRAKRVDGTITAITGFGSAPVRFVSGGAAVAVDLAFRDGRSSIVRGTYASKDASTAQLTLRIRLPDHSTIGFGLKGIDGSRPYDAPIPDPLSFGRAIDELPATLEAHSDTAAGGLVHTWTWVDLGATPKPLALPPEVVLGGDDDTFDASTPFEWTSAHRGAFGLFVTGTTFRAAIFTKKQITTLGDLGFELPAKEEAYVVAETFGATDTNALVSSWGWPAAIDVSRAGPNKDDGGYATSAPRTMTVK